jgi:hypothetical protein
VNLYDWKNLGITVEIMAELKRRQSFLKEQLADQAGLDPLADREKVGLIKGYEDMLNIELDDDGSSN